MVAPHHDVCRITDTTVTRDGVAYDMGRQAFLDRMLYDKAAADIGNPFNNNEADAKAWSNGFADEYADHQTLFHKGVRLLGFGRKK